MGSQGLHVNTTKNTIFQQGLYLSYAVSHMQGWRPRMQNTHIAISPLNDTKFSLFAIIDGFAGAEVATFVSRYFAPSLLTNCNFQKGDYELALKQTFLEFDEMFRTETSRRKIREIKQQLRMTYQNQYALYEQFSSGCSADVCLITPQYIYLASVGNCQSVACVNGITIQLSTPHNPQNFDERIRIEKAGGFIQNGRINRGLNISRVIGALDYKQNPNLSRQQQLVISNPQIHKIKNENIDFLLIGSMGIWQTKTPEIMVNWIKAQFCHSLNWIIEQLFQQQLAEDCYNNASGQCDMSAVLIRFNQ